jgi:hypothetical protein
MGPIEKKLSGFRYFRIHQALAHHIAKESWTAITVFTAKLRDVGQAGDSGIQADRHSEWKGA